MMPTALIVDDEPQANSLLAALVQLRGYRTVSALNGREAIDALEREAFDVVFLDLMLPDINGYEVCTHIKTCKTTALTPVIMVTARVAVENRMRSFLHGADNYVAKPYTPDQIFEAMDLADESRQALAGDAHRGALAFEAHDEGETLRRLSQLRSLLLAFSPLDADEVSRLADALRTLWESADAWGRRHGVSEIATLEYRVLDDRVEMRLRDLVGWLTEALALTDEPGGRPDSVASTTFDRVDVDDLLRSMTLVKRFDGDDRAR
jgi:DNA-binding response OmpR family regulator